MYICMISTLLSTNRLIQKKQHILAIYAGRNGRADETVVRTDYAKSIYRHPLVVDEDVEVVELGMHAK